MLNDKVIVNELKRAGVFHIAGISKDVDRRTRARLGVSPEGMTPMQLLEKYFEGRDVEAGRREELLRLARGIVAGSRRIASANVLRPLMTRKSTLW